jgi:CRP/FNR family cyclic AMP-dependent transcriptional regulator
MTTPPADAERRSPTPREEKIAYLSKSELFRDLPQEDLHALESAISMSTCERGRVFYTPGQTGEVLFILKRGRTNLYRITPEGKKLIVATVDEGSVFGEMSLIGQGMHDTFAEAGEDSLICVMSRSDVERMIRRYPSVGVRFLEHLAKRLEDTEERLAEVAYKSIPARIAATLLRLAGPDLRLVHVSQQEIADMVGTYRETTTRVLNEMRSAGLIDLRRMEIVVRDREGLEALAAEPRT